MGKNTVVALLADNRPLSFECFLLLSRCHILYPVTELRKLAGREKGYLAAAVTHQIRLNLVGREMQRAGSSPVSIHGTLSPGELSPVQEPVMGEAGALHSQEWADSQAAAAMDGKKETFERLEGAG